MADPRPADPWKLARLVLLLAVIVAFLAGGCYAWVRHGVPEAPYGYQFNSKVVVRSFPRWGSPRGIDPFRQLQLDYEEAQLQVLLHEMIMNGLRRRTGEDRRLSR